MIEEKEENIELSFGFAGENNGNDLQIEFADGIHKIPEHIIRALGGEDNLMKIAPKLKNITYAEFYSGVQLVVQKNQLNQFQKKFINNHFGRMF